MKHKDSRWLSLIVVLVLSAAASAQAPAHPKPATRPVAIDRIERDVAEALIAIQDNYAGNKRTNQTGLIKLSIVGMLETLDPHSSLSEAEDANPPVGPATFGIGVTIGDLNDDQGKIKATYVKATAEGSPANLAGLRFGDKIVEVDGISMLGKRTGTVTKRIRGPRGTKVKITVERLGTNRRETIEVTRDNIPKPLIGKPYMIRPGVGYMPMNIGFAFGTSEEFDAGLRALKENGMTQLVLDLRDNGGGQAFEAVEIASRFLSRGRIVYTRRGRTPSSFDQIRVTRVLPPETIPLVVLVNGSSASASELLAGALQDHDRALIVGERTFGKGLMQMQAGLEDGSVLSLTVGRYLTPSGRLIQRDYSGGLYNYRKNAGQDGPSALAPGPAAKTDLGRVVYGGNGIAPDVVIKTKLISTARDRARTKVRNPVFAFTLELAAGRVKGFETYRIEGPTDFKHDIAPSDFPLTDDLVQAFKTYAADNYHLPAAPIDAERDFVARELRYQLVAGAYGLRTAQQVMDLTDNQLQGAIDQLPQAEQLRAEREKLQAAPLPRTPATGRRPRPNSPRPHR